MSRNRLFLVAAALVLAAIGCLILGVSLLNNDIKSYVAHNYSEYSHDADGTRYLCSGSPSQVADTLADHEDPDARVSRNGAEYLRYSGYMVIVGPDGNHPCSIRVEDINAGYSHGAFIFLGPGFYPGSPAGGSGGSAGGPDGTK
jgi:hypothetical protein